MRLLHKHKWKTEAERAIEVSVRSEWEREWREEMHIARIEKCECNRVRGWLISATDWQQVSVPWLREAMKDEEV